MKCKCCNQEIPEPTSDKFNEFWKAYPKKTGKKKCGQIWKRRKLDAIGERIIENVKGRARSDQSWKAGFVPNPQTYINGDLWEDDLVLEGNEVKSIVEMAQCSVTGCEDHVIGRFFNVCTRHNEERIIARR